MNSYTRKNMWDCIHILAKTFTPDGENTKDSFVCFFECLVDLIPDSFLANSMADFMKQKPLGNINLISSDDAFMWTYRMHLYVNLVQRRKEIEIQLQKKYLIKIDSHDLTLDEANKKYSNISKQDWSHPTWFLIHFIAANIPQKISQDDAVSFKAFIVCLRYLLPCPECRKHMNEYIETTDIDPYLKRRNDIFLWTVNFHNDVNKRLMKEVVSAEDVFDLYHIPY
jgi:hypothetical protein